MKKRLLSLFICILSSFSLTFSASAMNPRTIYIQGRKLVDKMQQQIKDEQMQEIYNKLLENNLEQDLLKKLPLVTNDTKNHNEILIKLVEKGETENINFRYARKQAGLLKFGKINFYQRISNMQSILQTKLNCRGNIYKTYNKQIENSDDEESADPYFTNLHMSWDNFFHFTLNYSGSQTSMQPGNSAIRESIPYNAKNRFSLCRNYSLEQYEEHLKNNSELKKLLLALEVARRKVVDNHKNLKDPYCDLPIFCASIMAIELMKNKQILDEDFWVRSLKYHIYSGEKEDRERGIKNIIRKYIEVNNIKTLDQLIKILNEHFIID